MTTNAAVEVNDDVCCNAAYEIFPADTSELEPFCMMFLRMEENVVFKWNGEEM